VTFAGDRFRRAKFAEVGEGESSSRTSSWRTRVLEAAVVVPERWSSVSEIPKTSVGKFDKEQLRAGQSKGELEMVMVERARHRD